MLSNTIKKILFIAILMGGFSGYGLYRYIQYNSPEMYDFNEARDTVQMLEMFEKDWHWLFASPREEFSVEHSLKYLTPHQHGKRYHGALKIKVLRQRDTVL